MTWRVKRRKPPDDGPDRAPYGAPLALAFGRCTPMTTPRITVVGSANIDLTFRAARLPRPGETVFGTDFYQGFGGKGANQAVAAARLGARVAFVGRVGTDEF